ncbi:axin-1-like [Mercenaria mercenaria]|uniref:axin-1-like n=1 Tax=Mercenaria mercenaria TaxID=6596 RepID=UPI001E1E1ECA|nr:axin-1-like [Mercenaria mercenaria]
MSSKVDQFLSESGGNNFTETAPRPPVPGEENEKESNGGMSTRSSGSHKSQVSHTSGRSIGSNKGDINPATPRKSNIDKAATSNVTNVSCGFDDEMDAPLGFEPEGSAANSPPFTENSTPPYLKWAESLHILLDDRDGVQLFKLFLQQEGIGTCSVDFWFACRGLKLKAEGSEEYLQVIKIIHKKFIKSDKLPYVDLNTKRKITESIQSGMDVSIFSEAQEQVENYMKNDTYPLFLKSDLYIQYVSKEGESPKSSNSSSGSNSARPMSSGPLPTLKEDQELQQDDFAVPYIDVGPPPTKTSNRSLNCDTKRQEVFSAPYNVRPVPYHVSYAPVSAQDSEIQSISSSQDALTDDTRSLTDSSVDGHSYRESRKHKSYMKAMKRRAGNNREYGHNFIPRTERAPKDRNIAEVDCKKFAQMLIEKLLQVQKEREKEERVKISLSQVMNKSDINDTLDKSCVSATSSKNNTTSTSLVPLLTSSVIDEENADSILEEHCSRIWERSAQQTPSRSPGRHSPRSKSPDRFRKSLSQSHPHSGTSSMPTTLHSKPLSKKRGEFYSMSSFDSGMGEDLNKCSVETHKHIHHHHHHHHNERGRKSKHKLEQQAQQHSMMCWSDGTPRPHSSSGTRQKTGSRTHSDACSNLDSGISMVESVGQPQADISMSDPSRTKVLQWILDNENMNRGTSSAYTDSDKTSSTYKRSHKSSALTPLPQQPHKQSTSKKGSSSSHMNRSASADSGSRQPWVSQGGAIGVMPSQPIVQDPSMPLMPPPNIRVQLDEVKRRLHEADTNTIPPKSKSFTGVSNKDRRPGMPMSQSTGQDYSYTVPSAKTVPADLDISVERTEKKKRSSGSGNTSGSSKPDEISIGYYLCGEPIPYKTTIPQSSVTLGQLKQHISKRGNFRYFVKTYNKDFDSEAVYEEVKEDNRILPEYDGKILVKIERKDDLDTSNKSSGSDKKYQL